MVKLSETLGLDKGIAQMLVLSKRIPKSGEITRSDALILHVLFWQMKTRLSTMITKAERYELDTKQKRNNIDLDIQSECDEKSEAAKQRVAKTDKRWRDLQNKRIEAEVLRKFLERKREDFDQAVYVMRTIVEHGYKDEQSTPTQEI